MSEISNEELARLEKVTSGDEWNAVCDEIKTAHGGHYPLDWWPKVKLSGLMDRVMAKFGETSEMKVVTLG